MPDERDKHRRKTPPAGVKAQIAGPIAESWDEHTDMNPTPVGSPIVGQVETVLQKIERRTGETKNSTIDTLKEIFALRRETREDIRDLRAGFADTNKRLDIVADKATEAVAQNEILLKTTSDILEEQRETRKQSGKLRTIRETHTLELGTKRAESEIGIAEAEAKVELGIAEAKAKVELDALKAARAAQIDFWKGVGKAVLAGLVGLGALVATYLASRG